MTENACLHRPPGETPAVAMLLFNNSSIGGAERRYAWVYQQLRRRGVPILLAINESLFVKLKDLGIFAESERPDLIVKDRIGRIVFSWRKLDYLLACFGVARWVAQRRPRILHLVLGGAYTALPIQLLGMAPPAVLSVVCPSLQEMVGSQIGCLLYRKAWRRAAVIDALTESVRAMLNREGVDDQQIRVPSGSCVDTERFRPEEKQPWVVFSGRLIPEKNPLLFVEACALVREQLKGQKPNFRMFILGAGPMEDEVRALVDQRGLCPWTHMGWMEHVESILGQASVFVSLQRMDNYPSQALLEAMASCAAVVATDVGLTWKLVDDEVGRRVPGTPESVAHAIIELLENPDHAAAMGRRARERVVRHHSLERYLDYIQAVYAAAK